MTDTYLNNLTVMDIIIHIILKPLRKYCHPNFTLEIKQTKSFPVCSCNAVQVRNKNVTFYNTLSYQYARKTNSILTCANETVRKSSETACGRRTIFHV